MNDRTVRKFIIHSCIIVALSAFLFYELKYLDLPLFKKKHFLVIGILSAPENFQQRFSIRETWLKLLSDISASAYFIIGSEFCKVPPYDRADPYSCVNKPFVLPENATSLTEFSTMKIRNGYYKPKTLVPIYIGFSFHIRTSITINKLGILAKLLLAVDNEIQVKLISAFDNKVLASVTFNSESINKFDSQVLIKGIKPITLNASFEGIIKLDTKTFVNKFLPECNNALWESKPHVVNFIHLWEGESVIPQPFNENSCTFVFMEYTIPDIENIKQHINNRTERWTEWQHSNKKLYNKLNNEIKEYKDISLVDVTDVYRNLSMKMAQFYERILNIEYFHYFLKTDDDSFIDVLRVYERLKRIKAEINYKMSLALDKNEAEFDEYPEFWMWSSFKEFWRVERSGKWREDEYKSASYPIFPCGGGYVINKEIINYISTIDYLHHFQGEDVSIGIWLSTQPVIHYKIPKIMREQTSNEIQKIIIRKFKDSKSMEEDFNINKTKESNLCEWTCNNIKYYKIPLCNKVQLSVQNMYETWNDFTKKGFL